MRVVTILQTTPQAHEMTKQEHRVTAITTYFKIIIIFGETNGNIKCLRTD
jgi:hypothetical protein